MFRRKKLIDRHRPQISERDLNALASSNRRINRSVASNGYSGIGGVSSRSATATTGWWQAVVIDGRAVDEDNMYYHPAGGNGASGYYIEALPETYDLDDLTDWPDSAPPSRTRDDNGDYIVTYIQTKGPDTGYPRYSNFWPVPTMSATGGAGYYLWIMEGVQRQSSSVGRLVFGSHTLRIPCFPDIHAPMPCQAKFTAVYTGGAADEVQMILHSPGIETYAVPDTIRYPKRIRLFTHRSYPHPAVDDITWIQPCGWHRGRAYDWFEMNPRIPMPQSAWGGNSVPVYIDTARNSYGEMWSTDT